MKTTILVGLCVVLGVHSISLQAEDTPAQVAARAALQQKLGETNRLDTQPTPRPDAWLNAPVVASTKTATNATEKSSVKAATVSTSTPPTVTNSIVAPLSLKPVPAGVAPKPAFIPVEPLSTNVITSAAGSVYTNATVEKVEPDGIVVSYRPAGGGIAIIKIDADNLPHALRVKYGFETATPNASNQK